MSWLLALRVEELRRRVGLLSREVDGWVRRSADAALDFRIHKSQLDAIKILVTEFEKRQSNLLGDLRSTVRTLNVICSDGGIPQSLEDYALHLERYKKTNVALVASVTASQRLWEFFRQKLELRFSPDYKEILWIADTVAWNCYRPIMDDAISRGIIQDFQMREPPLTYVSSEQSPATWVRGSRPDDGRALGEAYLPIPVIEIPADHLSNVWELIILCHEVGHDIEADLKLRYSLQRSLADRLKDVDQKRRRKWTKWLPEVFADLVAIQLAGPWFVDALMRILLLETDAIGEYSDSDPHPTPYLRMLMNAEYVKTLVGQNEALLADAQRIRDQWTTLYTIHKTQMQEFQQFRSDFQLVFAALMDTGFEQLEGCSVRQLMEYELRNDESIRRLADDLGGDAAVAPSGFSARHYLSAASLAASHASQAGEFARLAKIDSQTRELIRASDVPGYRGTTGTDEHIAFVRGFIDIKGFFDQRGVQTD